MTLPKVIAALLSQSRCRVSLPVVASTLPASLTQSPGLILAGPLSPIVLGS